MLRRVLVVPAMLILGMALPVSPASADPIQMMGGSVIIEGRFSNSVDIHGTQGFRGELTFGTVNGQWLCQPCGPPGTPIDLTAGLDTVDGAGTVELGGTTYAVGSIGGSPGTAVLYRSLFGGTVVLPSLAPRATLSAPFELGSGSRLSLEVGAPGLAEFSLLGRGTATLDVIANQFGDPLWELARVRYDFEPVPEPATLLLLGTGMFALAARRHRHQSRPPDRTSN